MFGAVKFFSVLNVLILNHKVTELPSVWERAANSAYHLSLSCLLRYVCQSLPLMFGMSFGFDSASS